jgi:hypothetical protein
MWMYRNMLFEEPRKPPYVLGHAIDITERFVAERALREKEHALRRPHDELERCVTERTVALEQANERLRVEIAERQRGGQRRPLTVGGARAADGGAFVGRTLRRPGPA